MQSESQSSTQNVEPNYRIDSDTKYDAKSELTFNNTYREFLSMCNIDSLSYELKDKKRVKTLRSECRNYIISQNNNVLLNRLKSNRKNVPINNLSYKIEDPFVILNYDTKSSVQDMITKHASMFSVFGSYAYSCSCGSGKTLAAIYLMYKLQCKTLIISSRNAINDQWKMIIETLYPGLVIETKDGKFLNRSKQNKNISLETDIYIYSPQWLGPKLTSYMKNNTNDSNDSILTSLNPSLIIYDEVHSLLSPKYIRVLLFPLINVINYKTDELPYMIALSATYPHINSREYKTLNKMFGKAFRAESTITQIPVYIYDYYDHYTRVCKEQTLKSEAARGQFDKQYKPLNDYECVEYYAKMINDQKMLNPNSTEFKGLIMTYQIDSSVYAALYVHKLWNCDTLLMRSVDEKSIFIASDQYLDYEFDYSITLNILLQDNIGKQCEYNDYVNDCAIIVGTFHRLKEGFSVQNITWGICTKFVWSTISRIQILGRIRRNSNNETLNKKKRIMFACSMQRPSNIGQPFARKPYKFTYDIDYENKLFAIENYKRI